MVTLTEQLDAMLRLKENWDGYGADPIQPGPVLLAKEFVLFFEAFAARMRPAIRDIRVYPTRSGGVQIEWEDDTTETEMEIYTDGRIEFLFVDKATGKMRETAVPPGTGAVQPEFLHQLRSVLAA